MRKFFKIVLFLIPLIMISYWGYKQLNKTSSLLRRIPINAESVLKVGVHDIKETLALDIITSPKYYYKNSSFFKKEREEKNDSLGEKGIDLLPYSLVFYTLEETKNTVFTTFLIDRLDDFEAYMTKSLKSEGIQVATAKNGEYRYAIAEKLRVALAWNTNTLVIALSPKVSLHKFKTAFNDVLIRNNVITDKSHPFIEGLSSTSNHIVYLKENDKLSIDFRDGAAIVKGNFLTETPNTYPSKITYEKISNASFQLIYDANFESQENKDSFINGMRDNAFFSKNNLNIEVITDRSNGFFNLAVHGRTKQMDTIIAYSYDDNFEKIEKKTLQEREVPDIHINLGTAGKSLKAYLAEQGTVTSNGMFKAFPYYKLFVTETNSQTIFSTSKENQPGKSEVSPNFFSCQVNFEKLKTALDLPQVVSVFTILKELQITAQQQQKGTGFLVEGKLTVHNTDSNILSELFFGLKENE